MAEVQWKRFDANPYIVSITLDRPTAKNAFTSDMARQIIAICADIQASDARVVLIQSSTANIFCAGADLKERNGMDEVQWKNQHVLFQQMFAAIQNLKQPTIAIVDGYALAGGFEIVLNCDLLIATPQAKFGLPEVTRGIMPGCGGTRLLAKRIGVHRAKDWTATGRIISADEADRAGLVNRYVPVEQLQDTAMQFAEQIASNAPLAVQHCKRSIEELFGLPNEEAKVIEIAHYDACIDTEDRHEGVRAFVEKRQPQFQGR